MVLSSCPIFFRAPGVALLLRVARLESHDFRMKRTEESVSLTIGSNGSDRNLLISEMSTSVQNSSVEVWEDCLGHAHSASVNERPILSEIQQRIAQLHAQLTPQDQGISVAPVASSAQSSAPKEAYYIPTPPIRLVPGLGTRHRKTRTFPGSGQNCSENKTPERYSDRDGVHT